jgi:hypothetical protein
MLQSGESRPQTKQFPISDAPAGIFIYRQHIMRTLKAWPMFAVCIAAALPLASSAQQQSGNTAPPPPQLEKLEEGEDPAVTIRQPDSQRARTVEKRAAGGKVTEVQVTSGKSTYVLKANDSSGSALPGDTQGSFMRAPQWEVLEFDLGRPKDAKEAEAAEAAPVPAPPAPAPAAK